MSSPTIVSNYALSHIGISKGLESLDSDQSEEGVACRTFFQIAKDTMVRDFSHPFATKILALELVETTPNNEWGYSYRYPSTCSFFKKIQSGIRNDSRQTRVPYKIAKDGQGKLIFTDEVDAIGEWTEYQTDLSLWPPDSQLALSFLLAALIAPRLTAGDPFKLGQAAQKNYILFKTSSESNALNEEQRDEDPASEFIDGRS